MVLVLVLVLLVLMDLMQGTSTREPTAADVSSSCLGSTPSIFV